ncbi:MAG: hypothetical protein KGO96_00315 [Elusimicrobia bacterium]|nr:hypothetical protein [Elusimicrobiota bacterium]MDE2237008.1 hypothetical protein [Elusimicrobiota bacterium]MDE2424337.1 hypothetical protein [Elusimicrobiota bacterium]
MARAERLWGLAAVLGALLLAGLRQPVYDAQPILLLAKALLHHGSLSTDPLVRAQLASAYALAPKLLAWLLARLDRSLGLTPETAIAALKWALWAAQAYLMYRLAYAASGRREAALLATLFIGAQMPLLLADASYNLQGLRRSLGMPPLLWGLWMLLEGKRWRAWLGIAASTYLHATPGIYLWPLLALEEARLFWLEPAARPRSLARVAAAAALALPLLSSAAAGGGLSRLDPDFLRTNMGVVFRWYVGGSGLDAADWVFLLEGAALVALALRQSREDPGAAVCRRLAAVCLALLAFGTLSLRAYRACWTQPERLASPWRLGLELQPWISLCLAELAGQLALAGWLARRIREEPDTVLAILLLLSLSAYHDFVARLFCLGLCACLLARRSTAAAALTLACAALPWVYRAAPGGFQWAVHSLGLRGGLFRLPAFEPAVGLALAATLPAGAWLRRHPRRCAPAALCAAALMFYWAGAAAGSRDRPDRDWRRMARWIRAQTPADSVVVISPFGMVNRDCEALMSEAERSVYPCQRYVASALMYGAASRPLARRMEDLGFEFARAVDPASFREEAARADGALDGRVLALARRRDGATDLLLRSDRRWPQPALHREGKLSLYRIPSPAPTLRRRAEKR